MPFAIKELSKLQGWPDTEASLVFRDDGGHLHLHRARRGRAQTEGWCPFGLTTASEFGGLNVSVTKLNGITHNPWEHGRTAGGSSAGSAAAVAGGLCTLASGGDGGGSIRIPAGFCGLPGMKGTAGRIPRGPHTQVHPMTVVTGVMARSIRDIARYYDVDLPAMTPAIPTPFRATTAGRPNWAPSATRWRGRTIAMVPDLGSAVVLPEVAGDRAGGGRAAGEGCRAERSSSVDFTCPALGLRVGHGQPGCLRAELGGPLAGVREPI